MEKQQKSVSRFYLICRNTVFSSKIPKHLYKN